MYDFCSLPFAMKAHLTEEDKKTLESTVLNGILCLWYICYAQTMDRDNPWIALPKVWIRALCGQSMDCPALARSTDCATRFSAHVFDWKSSWLTEKPSKNT